MTSSWAAPAAVQVAPYRAEATGQGHWASGPIYSLSLSVVTILDVCPEQDRIHRITGACGPGVPENDMPVDVYHLVYVNIYMNL